MRYPALHSSILGGAGLLSPLASTLLEILDAVLVEGYLRGEVPVSSLGWSLVFDRYLNTAVYRPSEGLQLLYRVDDNRESASYQVAQVTCYESMSDVNTGFGGWGTLFFGKACGSDVQNMLKYSPPWWLIGDSKGFYLLIGDYYSYLPDSVRGTPVVMHYLGDFESLRAGDGYNTMIAGHADPNVMSSDTGAFFKSYGSFGVTHSAGYAYAEASGGALGAAIGLTKPEGGRTIGSGVTAVNPLNLSTGDEIPRLSPMLISNTTGPRGKMPGLFSVWPNIAGATGDTFTNSAGDSFMIANVEIAAGFWEQYAIQLNAW